MTASELYQAGQLSEAIQAAVDDVKKHPGEIGRRAFFCELLCFSGDLERADKQLDAIMTQKPDAAVTTALFRQLIRAETIRREVYEQGRAPEFLDAPSPLLEAHLKLLLALREGDQAQSVRLLAEIDEMRPAIAGERDGTPFDDLRDLDDLSASYCEVLTSTGKYYWIPWTSIESIEFLPVEHPRDLLWRPAHMIVTDGPDGVVYVPVTYPGTRATNDEQLLLGRATDWLGNEGEVIRGVGQRTWLFGDEDLPLLSVNTITFNRGEGVSENSEA